MLRLAAVLAGAALLLTGCSPSPQPVETTVPSSPAVTSPAGTPIATSTSASPTATADTSPQPTAGTSAGSASATCSAAQLTIDLSQAKPPGLNTLFGVLRFTNTGSSSCSLHGWPKVRLTDPNGRAISTADSGRAIPDTAIVLAPGAQAFSYLHYVASRNDDGTKVGCKETSSAKYGFAVTAPTPGASTKIVPNPSLLLCVDQKQSLIVWALMPSLQPLDIS